MQEIAIVYFVVAWLAAWDIDLVVMVVRGPLTVDPVLKFIVVTICLVVVLVKLARARWLW
jgi:hypothetical protein